MLAFSRDSFRHGPCTAGAQNARARTQRQRGLLLPSAIISCDLLFCVFRKELSCKIVVYPLCNQGLPGRKGSVLGGKQPSFNVAATITRVSCHD